eukprot:XP_001700751.1 flagellar associated protein [Chlamydomonas reinhardtii]
MDFAESWCSLLELFVSSAGLKLRMQLVDTVLFKSGRALGHFYTNRDGAVCRFSAHEITRSSIYQRLASLHNLDPSLNPYGYIAVAHYSTGVSRLLKRAELQAVMSVLSGPYEFGEAPPHLAAQHEGLFCLQSYLVPGRDLRYIAAYDLSEGPLCTVLGRRHSARYTHALDDPAPSLPLEALSDPDEPGFNEFVVAAGPGAPAGMGGALALTAVHASYNLWLNREGAPTDSMSARLALEVEALRERLQRQTDIAVRAEVALQQLAVSSAREAGELRNQVEELRIEVGRLGEAKRNLGSEYERLRTERLGLQAGRSELGGELYDYKQLTAQLQAQAVCLALSLPAGGGAGGTGAVPLASPTGSVGATVTFTKDAAGGSGAGGGGSAATTSAPALGARKPNYDHIVAHDLFLLSWTREALTARMLECHGGAVKLLAEQETTLAEIFNFYAQLGQVVWLDNCLTMNERQFVKLACETGVLEASVEETREAFRKVSDKTEFGSEEAANHPLPFIYFEQFPEAVLRLAALRYEWRPPENLEDAEEELYFAAPPFMPPNPSRADDAADTPPRPPETTLLQIIKTYLRDDLLPRARRHKTAGSARARIKSAKRTAPQGLWVSGKSTTAGV